MNQLESILLNISECIRAGELGTPLRLQRLADDLVMLANAAGSYVPERGEESLDAMNGKWLRRSRLAREMPDVR